MSASTVWQATNGSTKDFLELIPAEVYITRAFQGRFKTFSWEFACILRTRLCYIEAFKTGKLSFENRIGIDDKKFYYQLDKNILLKHLHETGVVITEILRKPHSEELALWLTAHENLHHGKLLLYVSKLDISLPGKFKRKWGEINFE